MRIVVLFITLFMLLNINKSLSQSYSAQDFVGTWTGSIESKWNYYNEEITITFYEDGTYQESTRRLMPSIYPNTQMWEINSNNRLQLKYLSVVYAGQKTYEYFIYDVVKYENGTIELRYNIHQNENPEPNAQKIILTKSTTNVEKDISSTINLLKVVSLNGEELPLNTQGIPAIYIYDDGSIKKNLIQK